MKKVVQNSYLFLIKGILDRLLLFEHESYMNHILNLCVVKPENVVEKLVITDKFHLYRQIWQAVLETLYDNFLPNVEYTFNWEIEITPYSLMLCEISKEFFESTEIEFQKQIMKLSDDKIERDYFDILKECKFDIIGLSNGLKSQVPDSILPNSKKEELILTMRLMNFPPLGELALFVNRYNAKSKNEVEDLSIAFSRVKESISPRFEMTESLHYSWFHIDHSTFKKHGLSEFEQHPDLVDYKIEFDRIRNLVKENKDKFRDEILCPCCGLKQEIILPEEILQYKYLLENQLLCKKIGLIYFNDFKGNFMDNLAQKFHRFIPSLNKVDNPDCIILVEGDCEAFSIPILAFRLGNILAKQNIQVYNSKSKEKLAADFFSMKSTYPKRKIICLLDSDAIKEKDNILRVIKDEKDKYRLIFLNKGTFEDIFDLDLSISVLNELYPDGESIILSDFDVSKDFLTNVKKVLFLKKKAKFDKVLFAKTISIRIDVDKLPEEILEILKVAGDFVKPEKFFRQK